MDGCWCRIWALHDLFAISVCAREAKRMRRDWKTLNGTKECLCQTVFSASPQETSTWIMWTSQFTISFPLSVLFYNEKTHLPEMLKIVPLAQNSLTCIQPPAAWQRQPTSIQLHSLKSDRGSPCRTEWTWRCWAAEWWRWRCTWAGWTHGCPSSRPDTCKRCSGIPCCACCCPSWMSRAGDGRGTSWGGCRSRGPGWGWRRLSWWQPGLR